MTKGFSLPFSNFFTSQIKRLALTESCRNNIHTITEQSVMVQIEMTALTPLLGVPLNYGTNQMSLSVLLNLSTKRGIL